MLRRLASPIPFFAKCSTASVSRLSRLNHAPASRWRLLSRAFARFGPSLANLLQLGRLGGDVALGQAGVQLAEQPAEGAFLDDRRGRDRALRRTDHPVTAGGLDPGSFRDPLEVLAFLELGHLPDRDRELRLADPGPGAEGDPALVEPLDLVDRGRPLGPLGDVAEDRPDAFRRGLDSDGVIEAHVPNGTWPRV